MPRSEYAGFSTQQAARKADDLMREALETGRWFDLPERLSELRAIMQRGDERQRSLI